VFFNVVKLAFEYGLYPHKEIIRVAALAYTAAVQGLHVLLEGPSGCGLTTLAGFLSYVLMKEKTPPSPHPDNIHRYNYPNVLLGPESTVENLIGVFKPTLGKRRFMILLLIIF
jgi:MoxR-like ATPase